VVAEVVARLVMTLLLVLVMLVPVAGVLLVPPLLQVAPCWLLQAAGHA
jgi:hypothetical protein